MELYDIVYDNNVDFGISNCGKFLLYRKYRNIPVCFIENDIVYVFLDKKISKVIINITKKLIKMCVKFYFTTPELSNPRGIYDYKNVVIEHYLFSYTQKEFFYGFQKIDFDIIDNLVKWSVENECYDLIKQNYEHLDKKVINRYYYDWFSNEKSYDYMEEIRDSFKTLLRDIHISFIL